MSEYIGPSCIARRIRRIYGWPAWRLAHVLGISADIVRGWESHTVGIPVDLLRQLSALAGRPLAYWFLPHIRCQCRTRREETT